MDDEGDFKKARGFLLTYSALVLALWYFGADLTQFKLMGNEIQLHQRTESVWLVLAALNAYFWFRFYQRIPTDGLYFDSYMNTFYESALMWLAMKLDRGKLDQKIRDLVASTVGPVARLEIHAYNSEITERPIRGVFPKSSEDEALKRTFSLRKYHAKVSLGALHSYGDGANWTHSYVRTYQDCFLGVYLTWPLKTFIIARGAFVTPWFTDHVMPLVLGGISTGFALWKWCDMNFFTTTLSHLAQSCVGVTN